MTLRILTRAAVCVWLLALTLRHSRSTRSVAWTRGLLLCVAESYPIVGTDLFLYPFTSRTTFVDACFRNREYNCYNRAPAAFRVNTFHFSWISNWQWDVWLYWAPPNLLPKRRSGYGPPATPETGRSASRCALRCPRAAARFGRSHRLCSVSHCVSLHPVVVSSYVFLMIDATMCLFATLLGEVSFQLFCRFLVVLFVSL